jgi:CBS domain-containing protein
MDIVGKGKRVRIYIGQLDKAAGFHDPLWETIMEFLRREGAAGATVFRGLAGFGANGKLHLARVSDLVPDLPVMVEWIDGPERVERLLPRIAELLRTGTITIEDIDIVRYTHRRPRPLPPDRVGDVMTRDVLSVQTDTPLGEVIRTLLRRDFRAVPVVDGESRLVGIITNHDLVERGGLGARLELLGALAGPARERELVASGVRERTAAEIMTTSVTHVGPDQPLDSAAHLMAERRLKRLPVTDDDGRLIGILSRVDVLRTMGEDYPAPVDPEWATRDRPAQVVGEVMRTGVPSVGVDAPIGEVLDAVTSSRLNRAIVVDHEQRVLGIVTDADLLRTLDPVDQSGLVGALMGRTIFRGETTATAREVMVTPAVTVTAETPVAEAAQRMLEARHKVLPIVDGDGRLLGAVDRADLLRSAHIPSGQT